MNKKTVRDIDLAGKRVLVRVDFNVPIQDGAVADDTRITGVIPTLQAILEQKPRALILMSHLGRPKGVPSAAFSLKPVVPVLAEKLGRDIGFVEDCIGEVAENAVLALPEGGVLVLENTRFHPEETRNDPEFSRKLASLGDVFVNDAFGTAHRAQSSTEGVTHYLPSVAGFLMEKEIEFLDRAISNPKRPFIAILGGAKISGKIEVIENLLTKADRILIGGGMSNTFYAAQGIAMGDSLVEETALETGRDILSKAGGKLVLPVDSTIADSFSETANTQVITTSDGVPDGWQVLDIGPQTIALFSEILSTAQTIVWNGPMGVFEMEPFAKGTFAVAESLAQRAAEGAVAIVGGGDSASAVKQAGLSEKVTHVSTGGGASLEMLEGKTLPGLAALEDC